MKFYLLKDDGSQNYSVWDDHIRLDGVWNVHSGEIVELKLEELEALIGRSKAIEKGKLKTALKKIYKVVLEELADKAMEQWQEHEK